uniref:DOMON domain-containing protein n=1 Tax=Amphimedon queenslandica TaxID=400682 RepID=A0A1X7SIF0_AMPQE
MSVYFFLVADSLSNNTDCTGSYSSGCTNGQCLYRATWEVRGSYVQFNVTGRVPIGQWLAIGFSDNRIMPQTDIALAAVGPDGRGEVTD